MYNHDLIFPANIRRYLEGRYYGKEFIITLPVPPFPTTHTVFSRTTPEEDDQGSRLFETAVHIDHTTVSHVAEDRNLKTYTVAVPAFADHSGRAA